MFAINTAMWLVRGNDVLSNLENHVQMSPFHITVQIELIIFSSDWGTEVLLPRPFYKHLCKMITLVATAFCTAMCLFIYLFTACKIEVLAIE